MNLEELFLAPPAQFRQAPFWFWNHQLDKDLLSWQIDQMEDKGLGGFVLHARHGLITPYLSDAWMDCIRHCCGEAKERGMIAWAYDARDWPSGPAGGQVIEDRANRMRYLRLDEESVPASGEILLSDDVVAVYVDGKRTAARPLMPKHKKQRVQKAVCFECPAILWFESYLDTLNKNACQAFIRSTYDYHEQKLGDLKTLGLAGFFTDEPALSTYPDDLRRIPWTPELPAVFQEMKGYDLLDRLPDLFAPGETGAQLRNDYWDVTTRIFEEAFFQPISERCERRGLQLIGHPLGEEPLFYQFRCAGNIFRCLKHEHMPGMDHLTITVGKASPQSMSPKLVASAALLAGRERTMTETFGESGWRLSLCDMKWMADWQMVNGINYIIPHAFYYSVSRRRKRDSPPSEFYQAAFWPYYRFFADYTARITAILTGGEHVAKLALFYPMGSVWAEFVPGDEIPETVRAMEAAFAPLGETLLSLHRDFVIVDEDALDEAQIDNGVLCIGGLRFEVLVLPPMTSLRRETLDIIRRMAAAGKLVAVGVNHLRLLTSAVSATLNIADIAGVKQVTPGDAAGLAEALSCATPDVVIDGAPDVYYLHRRKEGRDFYFFANTGREPIDTLVSVETPGAASIWDPENGHISPAPDQSVQGGRLTMPLRLPPMGSWLIGVDPAKPPIAFSETPFRAAQRIPVCDDLWHFTPFNGNFLALREWRFKVETQHKVTELRYSTEFTLMEEIANLRLILDGVPEHPYGVPEAARPLVAGETYNRVLLDGDPVPVSEGWEIDPHFRVAPLGHLKPGTHRIDIMIQNHGWFPQPGLEEYAWLAGDFMRDKDQGPPHLCPWRGVRIGAWENQGYPFFSGTAAYAADVVLPAELAGRRVFLDAGRVGDLLEVEINGQTVGVRPWPPYRLEITAHVWPGRTNLVVLKVTNSMRNFFEGPDKNRPSGLLEPVWIEIE